MDNPFFTEWLHAINHVSGCLWLRCAVAWRQGRGSGHSCVAWGDRESVVPSAVRHVRGSGIGVVVTVTVPGDRAAVGSVGPVTMCEG